MGEKSYTLPEDLFPCEFVKMLTLEDKVVLQARDVSIMIPPSMLEQLAIDPVLREVLQGFELRRCWFPIRMEVDEGPIPRPRGLDLQDVAVRTVLTIPDRDTGKITTVESVFVIRVNSGPRYFYVQALRQQVENMLRHEVAESFHVWGERVFDPHKER